MLRTAPPVATTDDDVRRRFTESAEHRGDVVLPTPDFHAWFAERLRTSEYSITPAPLAGLDGWPTDPETGNLHHRSGRFYTIEGLEVSTGDPEPRTWTQPIIVQPEIGILGILVKEFHGVLHFLMWAKMEPGNVTTLQLSPTIQATRSNYDRVHQGNAIPYLEHFAAPRDGRILADSLQSEQGSWFLRKRNRNMIVEVTEDVPVLDGFCWLTLAQLRELLGVENLINMDARSVLSTMPLAAPEAPVDDSFGAALVRSLSAEHGSLHDTAALLSWFTEAKSRRSLTQRRIPLNELEGWRRTGDRIDREDGRYFSVIGVDVQACDREVSRWSQPMVAPAGRGVLALITAQVDGVLHVLVQARTEAGTFDVVEMAPSVRCAPGNYGADDPGQRFLDEVLTAPASRVRFDVVHSEEGGRFYHAENRYLVVETEHDQFADPPEDYIWATAGQLTELVRHSHYLTVELRCLLTCLHALW